MKDINCHKIEEVTDKFHSSTMSTLNQSNLLHLKLIIKRFPPSISGIKLPIKRPLHDVTAGELHDDIGVEAQGGGFVIPPGLMYAISM